jgi:phage tail sheath protein FI
MALEYYTPGVYVEEISSGSAPMTAAPTNIVGFLGETGTGELNKPTLITSFADYFDKFIGYTLKDKITPRGTVAKDVDGNVIKENVPNDKMTDLDWGVYVFFANGGAKCYVVSVNQIEDKSEKIASVKEKIEKETKALESAKDKKQGEAKLVELNKELSALSSGGGANIDKQLIGNDGGPNKRTGLTCFKDVGEVAILCAPGVTSQGVLLELVSYAEAANIFAVVDAPESLDGLRAFGLSTDFLGLSGLSAKLASKQTALYFPWVQVADDKSTRSVSPSAFAAGIYARVDADRGVHKAPANEPVRLAATLSYTLNDTEQETLNTNGINCLRDFSDTGIRVWGARTTVSQIDPEWRYINVRRLFNMVEKSLEQGTKWAVFEPNDSKLWGSLTRNTKAFLSRVHATGAFAGSEAEGFFVKCDASNNPQENIDAGIVTIEVGIAPVKPAEFIVFKISQTAPGGAE